MRQTTVAWYVTTPWGRIETLHQEGAVVTVSRTVEEAASKSKRESWSLGRPPLADRTALCPDMARSILTGHAPWSNTPETWFCADVEASFEKLGRFVDTKPVKRANIIWACSE